MHVTPKSYLSIIASSKNMCKRKLTGFQTEKRNVDLGLDKLQEAQEGVDRTTIELKQQKIDLN